MLSTSSASDSLSLVDDPLAGQPYRALRLLGAGGMGEVFLAEHRTLATPCVVKIQHTRLARDPMIADRIRLEAESLARLNHENIVSIIGSGKTLDERPFIVMEYLRGQTMADELAARGQLPLLEALDYTCQLLRGLAAAHAVGIVHRDIKPDNLFLCDGPRDNRRLKLLDFGVARSDREASALGPSPLAVPTAAGAVVGALRYVSPEGALARRVDQRADLYSVALVLYLAIAGRGPFDHIQSALLLLSAHVAEEPEPPSRYSRTRIPEQLDRAILKTLRKTPDERFQSADELREELEQIMNQLRQASDTSDIRAVPEAYQRGPDSSGSRLRASRVVEPARAPDEPSGPLRIGARFLDKYEIRKQIGRGGQASVYLGQHIFTAREVAIKIIHSPQGMTREMLERGKAEARALGRLDHPNIVVMHDAGVTDEGLFYIVMEFLRGRSLRSALTAHGPLGVEEVLPLAISTAEALQVAHELGLIHRDLTPDNIYLTRDNRVKVLDFGIAKVLNEIGFTTHKDIVMGSILYMSPEQVQGHPLTPRSDICALGLLMFEMLLGTHPSLLLFEQNLRQQNEPLRRATPADIPPIQVYRIAPLLCELDPDIPMDLAQVVRRAIAKAPEARFPTMRDFVAALRACHENFCRNAPRTLRRAARRDLSLHLAGEAGEPASQRATPRRGFVWDGQGTLTPVPPGNEPLATTTAISGSDPDGSRFTRERAARRRRAWAFRAGVIAACLMAATLACLGALEHFNAAFALTPRAGNESGTVAVAPLATNAMVASLSPALPLTTPDSDSALPEAREREEEQPLVVAAVPRVASAPARSLPAARHSPPNAHAKRAPSAPPSSASAKSADKIGDVSRALEIELGDKRRKDAASSAEAPRKKLNGGKLIYGD